MQLSEEIPELKKNILSGDKTHYWDAIMRLAAIGGDGVFEFYVGLLDSGNPFLRNAGAHGIMYMEDDRALEPLLHAIFKPVNGKDVASLVSALGFVDCSSKLKEVFQILFYFPYECKRHAESILNSQEFEFYRTDIVDVLNMWQDLKRHPEKSPDFQDSEELIRGAVDGYLHYLSE